MRGGYVNRGEKADVRLNAEVCSTKSWRGKYSATVAELP